MYIFFIYICCGLCNGNHLIIKRESVGKMLCLFKSNQKSSFNENDFGEDEDDEDEPTPIMAYFVGTVELLF